MPKSGGRGAMSAFVEEFATLQAAEGTWMFQGWPLPNPDPILRATGHALPVYRAMLYDAHIGGLARRRRAAVKALDWRLETDKAKSKTVRLVQDALSRLDVPAMVGGLWEAALFGYACAEVMWEKRESHVLPRAVIAKPQEWFRFDSEGTMLFMVMGSANGVPGAGAQVSAFPAGRHGQESLRHSGPGPLLLAPYLQERRAAILAQVC